jgi:hypothetical protein
MLALMSQLGWPRRRDADDAEAVVFEKALRRASPG